MTTLDIDALLESLWEVVDIFYELIRCNLVPSFLERIIQSCNWSEPLAGQFFLHQSPPGVIHWIQVGGCRWLFALSDQIFEDFSAQVWGRPGCVACVSVLRERPQSVAKTFLCPGQDLLLKHVLVHGRIDFHAFLQKDQGRLFSSTDLCPDHHIRRPLAVRYPRLVWIFMLGFW